MGSRTWYVYTPLLQLTYAVDEEDIPASARKPTPEPAGSGEEAEATSPIKKPAAKSKAKTKKEAEDDAEEEEKPKVCGLLAEGLLVSGW